MAFASGKAERVGSRSPSAPSSFLELPTAFVLPSGVSVGPHFRSSVIDRGTANLTLQARGFDRCRRITASPPYNSAVLLGKRVGTDSEREKASHVGSECQLLEGRRLHRSEVLILMASSNCSIA